jgi:hypothetical protein
MQQRRRRHELPWAERSAGALDRSMKGKPLRRLAAFGVGRLDRHVGLG